MPSLRCPTNSARVAVGLTFIPPTSDASGAFTFGTYAVLYPARFATDIIGNMPCVERRRPSSDSSPSKVDPERESGS